MRIIMIILASAYKPFRSVDGVAIGSFVMLRVSFGSDLESDRPLTWCESVSRWRAQSL